MILNPGILALLLGGLISFSLMLYAAGLGLKILRNWDRTQSSEAQLLLERKTWLVSSLVNFALGFQVLSGLLFLYTLEDIHNLFVGAMCGTGSLNANPIGWVVLLVKVFLFFLAASWVAINRLDQQTEETPLVRPKYLALLVLTPLVGLDLYLLYSYFSGLRPAIITSCCGALFGLGNDTVASDLAALPPQETMLFFYVSAAICLLLILSCLRSQVAILRPLLFSAVLVFFFIALVSVISFISLYIYEMPSHHCPFDMLQRNYGYIGYPLYTTLFAGVFFGMLPGLCQPLKKLPGVQQQIQRREKNWLLLSLGGLLAFVLISGWSIWFGPFILLGY